MPESRFFFKKRSPKGTVLRNMLLTLQLFSSSAFTIMVPHFFPWMPLWTDTHTYKKNCYGSRDRNHAQTQTLIPWLRNLCPSSCCMTRPPTVKCRDDNSEDTSHFLRGFAISTSAQCVHTRSSWREHQACLINNREGSTDIQHEVPSWMPTFSQ